MISTFLLASLLLQGDPVVHPSQEVRAEADSSQESVVASALREMERGRYWHAARVLSGAFPNGPGGDEEMTRLFARAEAGWHNWPGVRALLEAPLQSGSFEDAESWYLLGRAREGEEGWGDAEEAYGRALGSDPAGSGLVADEVRARRARVRGRLGDYWGALRDLETLNRSAPVVAGWAALDVAERAAEGGFKEETRLALSLIEREEVRRLGWSLLPRAVLASGDSTGAEAIFWSALPSLADASDRALAWDRVAVLRMARGDSVGAKGAFRQVLKYRSAGGEALRAAEALLELGFDSVDVALAGARSLAGAGRHGEALGAYDVYRDLLDDTLPTQVRIARARSQLGLRQGRQALSGISELVGSDDPSVSAVALSLRVQALRQLGRGGEARVAEDELVERFPERSEALEIVYSRADALRSRGDLEGAIAGFRETAAMAPSLNLAGEARMRMGQLLIGLGRGAEALEVYSSYLRDFPDGRRWDQAAFWAGRLLLSQGREEEGMEILARLPEEHPLSYYAIRAAELLSEPYDPPIPEHDDPLPFPLFLQAGLADVDRLLKVGLDAGAAWEVNALAERLRGDPDTARRQRGILRLALEMNSRGFTREGINLGWELRRDGRQWDRNLLAAVYPFPYRDMVLAEALERGVDPFLIGGLIRQESAFWVEARSRADARGLMQVLPTTGRELARASGVAGFRPDAHLYLPEINLRLGVAFFVDMRRTFGEDLPVILSAYNAGPSRARRWRQYPEARDMLRFVERIPFSETRGYVKNVIANRAIYTWLYGPALMEEGEGL